MSKMAGLASTFTKEMGKAFAHQFLKFLALLNPVVTVAERTADESSVDMFGITTAVEDVKVNEVSIFIKCHTWSLQRMQL